MYKALVEFTEQERIVIGNSHAYVKALYIFIVERTHNYTCKKHKVFILSTVKPLI